jgi:hypothetical protein
MKVDHTTPQMDKKPYSTPRLRVHGNLAVITRSNTGSGHMDNGTGGMKTS